MYNHLTAKISNIFVLRTYVEVFSSYLCVCIFVAIFCRVAISFWTFTFIYAVFAFYKSNVLLFCIPNGY